MTAYDLAVIGAGSGGLSVAAAAAQFGRKVVLFERHRMGGDCLNTGCVPSKALLAAAKQAQAFRKAGAFGIAPREPQVDFAAVMTHVQTVIAGIAPHDSQERFESLGVRVVRAEACFAGPQTLMAGGETFAARRIVVATGSRPAVPPIPGLDSVPYLTNESLFENRQLPRHLVVIGGGPIGLEMAQAHRRLGSEVTVVEVAEPLAREDPELAALVIETLRQEGVRLLTRMSVSSVAQQGAEIAVTLSSGEMLSASHLLVAAGRQPNVEGLNLEAAGIAATPKGIAVDPGLRTTNRHVYAIGDVAGGLQFTHVASHQAGLVIRAALFALPVRYRAEAMPRTTFTDPELAQVGLTEAEARERHGNTVSVSRAAFAGNDRALAEADTRGLVKIVTGRGGRILGAAIAGAGAGELIQPWVLALENRLPLRAMAGTVYPYPTRGEASRRAAVGHYAGFATNSWVRRIIGLVARLR